MASWSDACEWSGCPVLHSSMPRSFNGSATFSSCVLLGNALERESVAASKPLVELALCRCQQWHRPQVLFCRQSLISRRWSRGARDGRITISHVDKIARTVLIRTSITVVTGRGECVLFRLSSPAETAFIATKPCSSGAKTRLPGGMPSSIRSRQRRASACLATAIYRAVTRVGTEVGRLAHSRRRFFDLAAGHKSQIAQRALEHQSVKISASGQGLQHESCCSSRRP